MTDKTKNEIKTIIIAVVAAVLGGGGGSYAINTSIIERLVKVETKIESLNEGKAAVEKERDELRAELAKVLSEVKEGQLYLRDTVMPAITSVQTDVAVLKSRR